MDKTHQSDPSARAKWFFPTFGGYVGLSTNLFLSNSKLALPYICRFIVFGWYNIDNNGYGQIIFNTNPASGELIIKAHLPCGEAIAKFTIIGY